MSASAPRGVTGAPPLGADRVAVTVTGTGSGSCAESSSLCPFVTGAVVPLESPGQRRGRHVGEGAALLTKAMATDHAGAGDQNERPGASRLMGSRRQRAE